MENGSRKEGSEKKKGRSVIHEVVPREHTVSIHKRIHSELQEARSSGIKEIRKFSMKEMGAPDMRIDTRLNKAVWAKGIRDVPYGIQVRLSRKQNEDEDSPNKLCTLATCVFKPCFAVREENVDGSTYGAPSVTIIPYAVQNKFCFTLLCGWYAESYSRHLTMKIPGIFEGAGES
ncbi:60S ribosomal protein L31-like [Octodon degus]|uniref:Large ribosomal subunit protein eL31 n=1 Tax=Octodon degus TaxID=10160 RepID=A0A6P6DZI7_OCTDE|nr:60S ribosomal protein L31-like [Octodon degus]